MNRGHHLEVRTGVVGEMVTRLARIDVNHLRCLRVVMMQNMALISKDVLVDSEAPVKIHRMVAAVFALVATFAMAFPGHAQAATSTSPSFSALPQLSQIQQWLRTGSQHTPLPKALARQLSSVTQSNFQGDPCRQMPSAEPVAKACSFGDLTSSTVVVLYGDSFAEQLIPALSALGSKNHFRLDAYSRLGCPFAAITISNWLGTVDQGCAAFRANVSAAIKAMDPKPSLVVLSEMLQLNAPTNHAVLLPVGNFIAGLTKSVQDLTSTGLTTRVVLGVPQTTGLPATCLAKNVSNLSACALPPATAFQRGHDHELATALGRTGAKTVNVSSLFCATLCPVVAGNYFVHSDTVHVNAAYATATATGLGSLIGCSAAGAPKTWLTQHPIFTTLLPGLSNPTVQAQCQVANAAPLS